MNAETTRETSAMRTWIEGENGNRASVEYWGSEEAARKSLETLENCSDCSDCWCCSYCLDCSRCVNGADLPLYAKTLVIGGDKLPTVVFDLESGFVRIEGAVLDKPDSPGWYECETEFRGRTVKRAYWWNGTELRGYKDGHFLVEISNHRNFRRLVTLDEKTRHDTAELTRLRGNLDKLAKALPTYKRYSGDEWHNVQCAVELLVDQQKCSKTREDQLRAENARLKQALAGHLFDGESVGIREAIRSQLITDLSAESTRLTAERDRLRDRLQKIEDAANADAADLKEMRDGTKLTRAGLVMVIAELQDERDEARRLLGEVEMGVGHAVAAAINDFRAWALETPVLRDKTRGWKDALIGKLLDILNARFSNQSAARAEPGRE
jgi:hypothetical protein